MLANYPISMNPQKRLEALKAGVYATYSLDQIPTWVATKTYLNGKLYSFTLSSLTPPPPILYPFESDINNNATWRKLLNFQYTSGMNTGLINLITVPASGLETGTWFAEFLIALDQPFLVYGSDCKRFYVGTSPIGNLTGNFTGSWTNQTFGSTGSASFVITQSGTGSVSVNVNLTGNVFGSPAPGQFTLTGTTDPQGNISLNLGSPIGFIFGTINSNGVLNGSIDVQRLQPSSTIKTVTFSGAFQGLQLNLNYTVNFVSGSTATGVVTATNATAGSC